MNILKLCVLTVTILLSFSGCERIVYVQVPCPKLQTVDVNSTEVEPLVVHYRVKDSNE